MYSSASEKSDEKGRGVGGAILDEILDADLDRLENLNECCLDFGRGKGTSWHGGDGVNLRCGSKKFSAPRKLARDEFPSGTSKNN